MNAKTGKSVRKTADGGRYVYCIIETDEPRSFGPAGIGGRGDEVYTLHHGGLAAVVSNTPAVIYDPTREHILNHEEVVETVMREFTVLPMAFGTVFRSEQDVIEIMRVSHKALRRVLAQVDGKEEYGLKVSWDRQQALADIERESKEIRALKQRIAAGGQTYHARIELGRLVEAALKRRADKYIREIYDALRDAAVASNAGKPIGDKMIMNGAFLVERGRAKDFYERVESLAADYEGELSFKPSGPWPPYNFVRIRLQAKK